MSKGLYVSMSLALNLTLALALDYRCRKGYLAQAKVKRREGAAAQGDDLGREVEEAR